MLLLPWLLLLLQAWRHDFHFDCLLTATTHAQRRRAGIDHAIAVAAAGGGGCCHRRWRAGGRRHCQMVDNAIEMDHRKVEEVDGTTTIPGIGIIGIAVIRCAIEAVIFAVVAVVVCLMRRHWPPLHLVAFWRR